MMPSHPPFMAICVTLAACFLCTTGALAQTQPVPQPDPAGRSALAAVPGDIRLPTFEWKDRRYKIEAVSFKARDETGYFDWTGSDEVVVYTQDAKGWTISDEFDDVDTGETHNFDPAKSCLVGIHPGEVILGKTSVCDAVGVPAPLYFEVEFYEMDTNWWPFYFCPGHPSPPSEHTGPGSDDCLEGGAHDFIGYRHLDFSMQDLETALPNVGAEYIETVTLFPCPKDVSVCGAPPLTITLSRTVSRACPT